MFICYSCEYRQVRKFILGLWIEICGYEKTLIVKPLSANKGDSK